MVVHLITRLAMGGAQQLVYDITRRMHETDQEVLIFTGLSDETSLSAKNNRILDEVYAAEVPVEVCRPLQDRVSLLNDLRAFLWLCVKLRQYRPSIVHIHSSKAGILGRLACRVVHVKSVIYHVHGWSFSRSRGLTRKLYLWLERAFYGLTTEYIFVCRQDVVDFRALGGNPRIDSKSHVIHPGTDFLTPEERSAHRQELRERLGYREDDHVIGSIGRLDYQKNPDIFVTIAHQYAEANPKARFLWIGEGQDRAQVERRINQLGLSDSFRLLGYIEDVEPYFSILDTFALTSRYEGLPLTTIKALACGTPVVGFLVNGVNDLHDKFRSVFGVAPGNVKEFAEQLERARTMLMTESEVLEEEAHYVREHLSRDRMYDEIMAVYAALDGSEYRRHTLQPESGVVAADVSERHG